MRKEASLLNIMIFIGAWSTTKIPMLLFEVASMGWRFMLARLTANILFVVLSAYLVQWMIGSAEKARIFANTRNLD